MVVPLTMTMESVPSLNPDPLIDREVMRSADLRVFRNLPSHLIYAEVSLTLTTSGEQRFHSTKFPKCQSCELTRIIDPGML
jgi:hypothetical protein